MRVLLDVGAHVGDTVRVALDPTWAFDEVYGFEPTGVCLERLATITDPRFTVVPAGWWHCDTELEICDPGTLHASVLPEASREGRVERCQLIDAAAWMAEHINERDTVWLKMNIEGAEVAVLRHLMDSGEIRKVDHLVVHFDIAKYGRGAEVGPIAKGLHAAGIDWHEANEVLFGRTDSDQMRSWLGYTNGHRLDFERRRVEHKARALVWRTRKRLHLI